MPAKGQTWSFKWEELQAEGRQGCFSKGRGEHGVLGQGSQRRPEWPGSKERGA